MIEAVSITNAEALPPLFAVYRWGIDLIQWIQSIQSPPLTGFVKFITALGTEYFYVPVILLIFWCVNEKKGASLGFIILVSTFINGFFKELLKQPRPFSLEPSVGLAFEPSYGIPSGHAQLSLCFLLFLAFGLGGSRFGRRPVRVIRLGAILLILLIAFTRLYLGVHFPTDILAGWILGALTLGLWFAFRTGMTTLLNAGKLRAKMITIAAIAFGMNALFPADPRLGGIFLGFGAGYALTLEYVPFNAASGPFLSGRCLRYGLGIAGCALIYGVLGLVLPGGDSVFSALPFWGAASPYYALGRFIRYGLLGLWVSAGAPWLFLRLRMAEPGRRV
ncbi:MAG: phosphatase PAP2 family protein [Treponema sp.]|jgi:membrane-associated phospholipid phosphatase|nr:phosphatase PAP2 family protein [Treponema sp.]